MKSFREIKQDIMNLKRESGIGGTEPVLLQYTIVMYLAEINEKLDKLIEAKEPTKTTTPARKTTARKNTK